MCFLALFSAIKMAVFRHRHPSPYPEDATTIGDSCVRTRLVLLRRLCRVGEAVLLALLHNFYERTGPAARVLRTSLAVYRLLSRQHAQQQAHEQLPLAMTVGIIHLTVGARRCQPTVDARKNTISDLTRNFRFRTHFLATLVESHCVLSPPLRRCGAGAGAGARGTEGKPAWFGVNCEA